jgi:hypothetical protein
VAAGKMPEIKGDDDICPGCISSLDNMSVRRIDQWQQSERHFGPKPGQRLRTSQRKKLEQSVQLRRPKVRTFSLQRDLDLGED